MDLLFGHDDDLDTFRFGLFRDLSSEVSDSLTSSRITCFRQNHRIRLVFLHQLRRSFYAFLVLLTFL